MRHMIRVGLVDDQQLVRAGFAMVIGSQDDLEVTWEALDGQDAVQKASEESVDVILMDIRMPGMDGIMATTKIIESSPSSRIIVLTTFDNDDYVVDSIAAGASGFLLKDADPEDLLEAIRVVAAGESVLATASTAHLLKRVRPMLMETSAERQQGAGSEVRRGMPTLPDPLTPREKEILTLVARGHSNTEIAAELFISMPTVKTHVGHILTKTNSRDRVQAVIFAFRSGLVGGDDLLAGK